jgi:hypothetical protein
VALPDLGDYFGRQIIVRDHFKITLSRIEQLAEHGERELIRLISGWAAED